MSLDFPFENLEAAVGRAAWYKRASGIDLQTFPVSEGSSASTKGFIARNTFVVGVNLEPFA